ncbi:EAL domain-containing protein [Deinococcus sp. HMF7604]|uniref:putative bifunctional diguanylate cyclase/phosphodiesterase n=1 Tax=Deinococcus betulae TaxID=2873312 RepID=UPI001CCA6D0D|nr:bifunctional diguanylate cyclase/phosphodiesterase [Deinococcus betulae]MBZ9752291.1 EAL domain-containing protein [Deinococcus betulae]
MGHPLDANPAFLAYSPTPDAPSLAQLVHPDDDLAQRALEHFWTAHPTSLTLTARPHPDLLVPAGTTLELNLSAVPQPPPAPPLILLQVQVTEQAHFVLHAERKALPVTNAASTSLSTQEALQRTQDRLRTIMDHLPGIVGYKDRALRHQFGNAAYQEWYGRSPQEMQDIHIRDVIGEAMFALNEPHMRAALAGEPQHFERLFTDPAGRERYALFSYIPDQQPEGVQGFFVMAMDITERRQAELTLIEEREWARTTLNSIGDGVITTDPTGHITFINPVAQSLTGWTAEEAQGQAVEQVIPLTAAQPDALTAHPLRLALQERRRIDVERDELLTDRHGQVHAIVESAAPIVKKNGGLLGGVFVFHDVSEARVLSERMRYLAQHDVLTDLPNRVLLQDRVFETIQQARRLKTRFAVLFLDLDHFKHVNDALGHHVGDELLQAVADRLRGALRASDTVSRQGGDEFIILLPDVRATEHVERVIDKLMQAVTAPYTVAGRQLNITLSLGVALYPEDGQDTETLLQHADAAMYRAKGEGRNRHSFFSADLHQAAVSRQTLHTDLRLAVEQQQFTLVYQPKIDLQSRQVLGVEALLRWVRPGGQLVSPLDFIPVAEETRLILPLGAWVLEQACRQSQAWAHQHGMALTVSVNISPVQFTHASFLETVQRCLQVSGLAPEQLELELTESMLMANVGQVQQTLTALKGFGVRVSIDDFGTGYSSLSYLKTFPVDVLKIDRSFLRGVPGDEQASAVVTAIIALARSLKLDVIAEGVETDDQAGVLLNLGCTAMQGYLFGRPMPAAAVPPWWTEWVEEVVEA